MPLRGLLARLWQGAHTLKFMRSIYYPASTATLCVLPVRKYDQPYFSILPAPMPAQLCMRLTDDEFNGTIASINRTLLSISGFGILPLLLPFIFVDVATIVLLSTIYHPLLQIMLWDYPVDMLLPAVLEFCIIVCSFPLMAHAVNRRMTEAQARVRELLDESSRRYGARGVNFQLKQGVLHSGAATNLWIEVQIVSLVYMQSPIPLSAPTICPIILPLSASSEAALVARAASESVPAPSLRAANLGCATADATAGAASVHMAFLQMQYLRVLQENQLLKQCIAQYQILLRLIPRHEAAHRPR